MIAKLNPGPCNYTSVVLVYDILHYLVCFYISIKGFIY